MNPTDLHRVLVADPPWKFGDRLPGKGRGAEKHYQCLDVTEIMRFPLPPLDDNCVLLLWRVAAMQQEALDVARAWGFKVKGEIVWNKRTKHGRPHFGMGRIFRASHETCIVATRGRVSPKAHNVRDVFDAPVGVHSQKPVEFYEIVEFMFEGPYAEMFARRRRDGWSCFGNEIE